MIDQVKVPIGAKAKTGTLGAVTTEINKRKMIIKEEKSITTTEVIGLLIDMMIAKGQRKDNTMEIAIQEETDIMVEEIRNLGTIQVRINTTTISETITMAITIKTTETIKISKSIIQSLHISRNCLQTTITDDKFASI